MMIREMPSPNFNDRRTDAPPSLMVLHITNMRSAEEALARLCDPAAAVSAHYTVDEDGTIYRHVPEDKRAWHAGQSYWRGETDINSHSLGIELVNPGPAFGYRPFPEAQIASLISLCTSLIHTYALPPDAVLAHADVAPERRWFDPGELFPWAFLASEGIGIWPQPQEEDFIHSTKWSLDDYVKACHDYGYDPYLGYEWVLRAYERHFAPDYVQGLTNDEGVARARLACLLRQM